MRRRGAKVQRRIDKGLSLTNTLCEKNADNAGGKLPAFECKGPRTRVCRR